MSVKLNRGDNQIKNMSIEGFQNGGDNNVFINRTSSNEEDLALDYLIDNKENYGEQNSIGGDNESEKYNGSDIIDGNGIEEEIYDETPSNENILKEKIDYLKKISRLSKYNKYPMRHLGPEHRLEDIKSEYHGLKKDLEIEEGIKNCKHGIIFFSGLIEQGNRALDPIGASLDGWADSLEKDMNTGSWDQLLEEVYEKYLTNVKADPLVRLVGFIALSGFTHHITNKASKQMVEKLISKVDIKGPSIDADDILKHLNDDTRDDISDVCSIMSEISVKKVPIKKKGRPKKQK